MHFHCNLFAVLDLPQKVFTAGVKTVVPHRAQPKREGGEYDTLAPRHRGAEVASSAQKVSLSAMLSNIKTGYEIFSAIIVKKCRYIALFII